MNWTKVRLTCAWLLFGLGCIPAIILIAIAAVVCLTALICTSILFAIALICILPGMLIAPNQQLDFTYKKEDVNMKAGWDWGKLGAQI